MRDRPARGRPRGPLLGAHVSIAGGVAEAPLRARALGCEAMQIFTKSARQWAAAPLGADEIRAFRAGVQAARLQAVFAHDTYLLNLAAPDETLRRRSVRAFIDEVERCEALGLAFLVAHPGAHGGAGEAAGLEAIAHSLGEVLGACRGFRTRVVLEVTAGQGTSLGYRFEHLRRLIGETRGGDVLGVCFDTQHAFAAGYDLRSAAGYEETFATFDRLVGLHRLVAFHLNDAKKDLGSRVDRHEHIGRGALGLAAFRRLLRDPRFRGVPMCLETPKSADGHEDRENLAVLRQLRRGAS